MTQPHAKIIALVGLAGSGKSSAVEYLTEKGFPKIYFGGVIYKAMDEAGIEKTWDNQQQFREEIRRREGKDFVIKRVIKNIHDLVNAGQNKIVLDGLYTWSANINSLSTNFPDKLSLLLLLHQNTSVINEWLNA